MTERTMAKITPRNASGANPKYVRAVPVTEGSADTDSGAVSVVELVVCDGVMVENGCLDITPLFESDLGGGAGSTAVIVPLVGRTEPEVEEIAKGCVKVLLPMLDPEGGGLRVPGMADDADNGLGVPGMGEDTEDRGAVAVTVIGGNVI